MSRPTVRPSSDGGCDRGYAMSPCLWGTDPEPLVARLAELTDLAGARVLDAGCGEGRNAVHLARQGALVDATDVSELALRNAAAAWPDEPGITWRRADLLLEEPPAEAYDIVVFDSVAHWLTGLDRVREAVDRLRRATRPGGFHVVCSFNDRHQELENHVNPPRCVLPHTTLVALYPQPWQLVEVHDDDITSSHADQPIPHNHSVTRFIARRPVGEG
ncbi:class I SAM-dependent methyltransferase [Paractinoplanes hotanensis]|uniref:Class I SAM-dependent methyltransferase n=1 Tax=Paractinoplanes hotanensis TaxID=2906497 RepID=A0ABT0YAN5_9ACTN|nr:class I SAM-dependent methyltransferase [Actinoplanes hotanensis]MCM4083101.1 class I SAM-dependent methyltransferase [Actinoplanes hotanensis]